MKYQKTIIACLVLLQVIVNAHNTHNCKHEKDERIKQHYDRFQEFLDQEKPDMRVLQQRDSQPIRITVDWSFVNNNLKVKISQQKLQYLKDQMEAAVNYFSKLLKVNPIVGNNKYPSNWGTDCLGVTVPSSAISIGIPNSDLHLYVIVKDDGEAGDLANALACSYSPLHRRPTYGRVEFNLAYVGKKNDPESFENDLETTIHEVLHVMGFSGYAMQYWVDPATGDFYGKRGIAKISKQRDLRGYETTILFSKNVLETARKYYNCPTMDGMQMENEGGSGSLGSHWEQLLVQNEMMMSQDVITDAQLSVHTIALLKDTGYYTEVNENMAENLYWGKGKGCDFVEKGCYSARDYPEFPQRKNDVQCSFENDGYGQPRTTDFMDKCLMKSIYGDHLCTSTLNQNADANERLETYSTKSKCFTSTASAGKYKYGDSNRCHEFKCAEDFSSIDIIIPQQKKTLKCRTPGQKVLIDASKSALGSITCPDNFEQFCDYVPICPYYCGAHGVCVRGSCLCNNGWSGPDCMTRCNQLVENGSCVSRCSRGNFENPDRSCQPTCPKGYFASSRDARCQQCSSECRECANSATNCTACQFLTSLSGNKCVSRSTGRGNGFSRSRDEDDNGNYSDDQCRHEGCYYCDQRGNCLRCNDEQNYILANGTCYQCEEGTQAVNNLCLDRTLRRLEHTQVAFGQISAFLFGLLGLLLIAF